MITLKGILKGICLIAAIVIGGSLAYNIFIGGNTFLGGYAQSTIIDAKYNRTSSRLYIAFRGQDEDSPMIFHNSMITIYDSGNEYRYQGINEEIEKIGGSYYSIQPGETCPNCGKFNSEHEKILCNCIDEEIFRVFGVQYGGGEFGLEGSSCVFRFKDFELESSTINLAWDDLEWTNDQWEKVSIDFRWDNIEVDTII